MKTRDRNITTIGVSKKLRNELDKLCYPGETFESLLWRIIEVYKEEVNL